MSAQIIFVTNHDDWIGMYIDGKICLQGHDLDIREVLGALGIRCKYEGVNSWLGEEVGELPEDYDDIPPKAYFDEVE